jgi:D-sedoheptulose 7-phosphate isomerase
MVALEDLIQAALLGFCGRYIILKASPKAVIPLPEMKTTSIAAVTSVAAKAYLLAVQEVLARLDHAIVDRMVDVIWRGYEKGRTLFLFGNGGSAALASHFACDIGKGTIAGKRRRLKTVALTDNVALITAWANDKAYDAIFAEQLESLAEKGDIALAISGSGNSGNVIRGLEAARRLGTETLVLTGFEGGRAKALADLCLVVPSDSMQLIEDAHLCATHAIFLAIRQRMMQTNGE